MTFRVYVLVAIVAAAVLPAFGQLSVSVGSDGNTINYRAGGSLSPNSSLSCTNVYIDDFPMPGTCNACPCPNLPLSTGSGICNLGGVHVVRANATGPGGISYDLGQQIIAVGPPPASCGFSGGLIQFEITDNTSPDDRRVLLSNTHVDAAGTPVYPYPHYQNLLAKDGVIPVNFRTIVDGVETSGIPVTLKVLDPADPSPYVAGPAPPATPPQPVPGPGSAYSRPGDNTGDPATLVGTALTDNGNGTYSAVSGENGFVGVELHLPVRPPSTPTNPNPTYNPAHPGDNYQLEVTATFPDGSTKTTRSGLITVWRRMFVEKRQMYRHGAFLATNAPAGARNIVIVDESISTTANNTVDMFAKNDNIRMLHAPSFGQPKSPSGYYAGFYTVSTVSRPFPGAAQTVGAGTVATTAGSTTIVGTGTRFTRLHVEDVITWSSAISGAPPEWRMVMTIADNAHLTVSAPATVTASNLTYNVGDPNLLIGANYRRLTLNRPLAENYQREPLIAGSTGVLTLNDAVARIAAATLASGDFFDSMDTLLTGTTGNQWTKVFPSAYTEYIVLPPQPNAGLGAVAPVPRAVIADLGLGQKFVDKWFLTPTATAMPLNQPALTDNFSWTVPANHQTLLIGDFFPQLKAGDTPYTAPVQTVPAAQTYSILYRGRVEQYIPLNTSNIHDRTPDAVLQKVEVHELTHQWRLNGGPTSGHGDHCYPEVAYNSPAAYPQTNGQPGGTPAPGTLFCTMSEASTNLTMPAPWDPTVAINPVVWQYGNGVTAFHMALINSNWDSEYLGIRKAPADWQP